MIGNFLILQDISAEAKALVEKHRQNIRNNPNWQKSLGLDLLNYYLRPELIFEVLLLVNGIYRSHMLRVLLEFIENLSISQISSILETKKGMILIDRIEIWLDPTFNKDQSIESYKLTQLYMKIESVRVPKIANDKRPYIGDMVDTNEDLGIDPSITTDRTPYGFRFGPGHDGEHWLTKNAGAQVKATSEIKGTVLTYYSQGTGVWNVMILLDNTKIVLLLKDLVTLGPKIKQSLLTTPDNIKTPIKDESRFIDRNGNPINKVKLNAGDIIGTTMPWKIQSAKNYYPNYSSITPGTFHFALMKYEFVQQYRSKATTGDGIAPDEIRDKMTAKEREKTPALSWYIAPCSPESPIKCFK